MSPKGKRHLLFAALVLSVPAAAQQAEAAKTGDTIFSNMVFNCMLAIIVLLLLVIIGLAEMVKAGAALQRERRKKNRVPPAALLLLLLLPASSLQAQDAAAAAEVVVQEPPFDYWGMGAITFFVMLTVIVFELLVAAMLFRSGMALIRPEGKIAAKKEAPTLMERMNRSVAVEQEEAILLDHDYDGIRELDNSLPPWWLYGFYATIIFAVIYIFHYHILDTGKLSYDEYVQELKEGEQQIAEYKKAHANLVDENNVVFLSDPSALGAGKTIYSANCVACHGAAGEGGIGPNLTDDYWLHGGSIASVFKSVKYGWTDKGMKSWQQDLKPLEIQQVVSYIRSLRGSNPPNARDKQGELYVEEGEQPKTGNAATDTAGTQQADTLKK